MRRVDALAALLIVALIGVVAYYVFTQRHDEDEPGPREWEHVAECSDLTSIDSQKSLRLLEDHTVFLRENTPGTLRGHWEITDDKAETYRIVIDGKATLYTRIVPPDGEGCTLAFGPDLAHVDLGQSWFSALPTSDQKPN